MFNINSNIKYKMHKHFYKQNKTELIKKINFALELNNQTCTNSELNGYSRKELKYINTFLKPVYRNIDNRHNKMYRCKY